MAIYVEFLIRELGELKRGESKRDRGVTDREIGFLLRQHFPIFEDFFKVLTQLYVVDSNEFWEAAIFSEDFKEPSWEALQELCKQGKNPFDILDKITWFNVRVYSKIISALYGDDDKVIKREEIIKNLFSDFFGCPDIFLQCFIEIFKVYMLKAYYIEFLRIFYKIYKSKDYDRSDKFKLKEMIRKVLEYFKLTFEEDEVAEVLVNEPKDSIDPGKCQDLTSIFDSVNRGKNKNLKKQNSKTSELIKNAIQRRIEADKEIQFDDSIPEDMKGAFTLALDEFPKGIKVHSFNPDGTFTVQFPDVKHSQPEFKVSGKKPISEGCPSVEDKFGK